MHLEHVLGEIDTDRANLHVDGPLMVIRSATITLWHFDAGSGRRPPHQDWTPIGGPCCVLLDTASRHLTKSSEKIFGNKVE